jgi:hypothetical protein
MVAEVDMVEISRELEYRFYRYEPIENVAFLLNDSVAVIAGPDRGSGGSIISLISTDPEPAYLVELSTGKDAEISQSQLIGADSSDGTALAELARWYSSQCDGDWEHGNGIEIGTLDNPGWFLRVNLEGTNLNGESFEETKNLDPVACNAARIPFANRFDAHVGPHMLGKLVRIFLDWARTAPGKSDFK